MTAHAAVTCTNDGRVNRLTRIRSEGQLVLRPTRSKGFEPWACRSADVARASLSAATAGPLGDDRLRLDVRVGAGAQLVLNEISATLALPGTTGEPSLLTARVQVEDGATLIWMPEPVIAARGCDHRQDIRVELAEHARFHLAEVLIVGRHGEQPGNIQQHLRVTRGEGPLLDQHLRLGDRFAGWDGPAVAGRSRCVGQLLVVDPGSRIGAGAAAGRSRAEVVDPATAVLGLAHDAVQISAVGPDNLAVGRALDAGLTRLGDPWAPPDDHTQRRP